MLRCKIICATPTEFIRTANQSGIAIYRLMYQDELTVTAGIQRRDFQLLLQLSKQYGAEINSVEEVSVYSLWERLLKRKILIAGLLSILLLSIFLPTRILFLSIDGNEAVSQKLIAEIAQKCGLYFGSVRRNVRSEQIKNELLSNIPQLQWVGVNTSGCVAEILVREKPMKQQEKQEHSVSSIVAAKDGIICDIVTLSGNAVCSVGQAVTKGQLLISGFTDCGISIKAEYASGSVRAYTFHKISSLCLNTADFRVEETLVRTKYSLKIGKNIINLSINSGISDTECAKIYEQRDLKLPGGYKLPVSLIVETEQLYSHSRETTNENSTAVPALTKEYLQTQMIDGEILHSRYTNIEDAEFLHLNGNYFCEEMIGRTRKEELPLWEKK